MSLQQKCFRLVMFMGGVLSLDPVFILVCSKHLGQWVVDGPSALDFKVINILCDDLFW